jgi:hypothetical protein
LVSALRSWILLARQARRRYSALPKRGLLFFFADMVWIEPADLAKERFQQAWGTTEGGWRHQ